jgi:capsular polysaccharide transport system permease protein
LIFGLLEPMDSLPLVMFGWISYGLLSASIGLSIAIVTDYWEASERLIAPIQYILFPISGTFFMVDWLPTPAQWVALLSPQIHCNEMIRAGMFGDTIVTHYNLYYPLIFSVAVFGACLYSLERVRDYLKLV